MLDEENINEKTGYAYKNICCLDIDPTNDKHVFAAGRCGLYEFNDGKLVAFYNKENSPLKGANDRGTELGNDYLLILGIKFDAQGNLWVLNSMAKGVSKAQQQAFINMIVPIAPARTFCLFPSTFAIFHAAAEVYPYPTIAPKEVRSTNQIRVFLPSRERRTESVRMNTML